MSITAPPAPTLSVLTDPNPSPRVVIQFTGLDASATLMDVIRIADGETTFVRGGQQAFVAGSFTIVDYEAPFTQVTYQAQLWNGAGSSPLGATATVDLSTLDECWLSDPLSPADTVKLEFRSSALGTISRTDDTELIQLQGRRRPIVQSFGAGAISQLPADVVTESLDDMRKMDALIGQAPLLLRTPDPATQAIFADLPRALYAQVKGSRVWAGWVANFGARYWQLMVDEAEPQSSGVVVNLISYATYTAQYATYQDAMDVFGTYEDAINNPPGGF